MQTPGQRVRTEGILSARAAVPMGSRGPIATYGPYGYAQPIAEDKHVSVRLHRLHGRPASAVRRSRKI
jgi:hypothetical protein